MWSLIFVGAVSFSILLLGALEISKYRNALGDRTAFAYPRRRLSRRLGIGTLMIVLMSMVEFGPQALPRWADLAWTVGCLVLCAVMFILILRDLREASLQALQEHAKFKHDTEQRLRASIESALREEAKDGD